MKTTLIALVIVALAIWSCSEEKVVSPKSQSPSLSVVGEWFGTLTATVFYDSDSVRAQIVWTTMVFDDSTYRYVHFYDNGEPMAYYHGEAGYVLTDVSLALHPTGPYNAMIDWEIIPVGGPPFGLDLDGDVMTLTYRTYIAESEYLAQQVVSLRKSLD